MRKFLPLVLSMLLLAACSDKNKQPSDADLKRIEAEHQKTMQQVRKLTEGQGNSMLRTEPQPQQTPGQKQQAQTKPGSRQKSGQQTQQSAQQ